MSNAINQPKATSLSPPSSVMKLVREKNNKEGHLEGKVVYIVDASDEDHERRGSTNGLAGIPSHTSHLPTPRTYSPPNVLSYFAGVTRSPESPLAHAHSRSGSGVSGPALTPNLPPRSKSPQALLRRHSKLQQIATPETSPHSTIKSPPSPILTTPRPSSAPLLSTLHDHLSADAYLSPTTSGVLHLHEEHPIDCLEFSGKPSAASLTPQPVAKDSSSISLFSPVRIVEKQTPSTRSHDSTPSSMKLEPSTSQDCSSRRPGGELDRIRAEATSLERVHMMELESRRPDFLKRLKRSVEGDPTALDETFAESDNMGITNSPVKGRRLQFFDFQQTSAESFEESLMTHGYGTYGVPRTPQHYVSFPSRAAQQAVEWYTSHTPRTGGSSSGLSFLKLEGEPSEKGLKKRKRLDAFKGTAARAYEKLHPSEHETYGRIVLPTDMGALLVSSPPKKRVSGKKKKALTAEKKKLPAAQALALQGSMEPNWPDDEFPWCLRDMEREEEQNDQEKERLERIDRYLNRDTDSDDDSEDVRKSDEEVLPSSTWGQIYEDPPLASRRGRGKAVPLRPDPSKARTPPRDIDPDPNLSRDWNMFFPTDSADARAALLSMRSIRAGRALRRTFLNQRLSSRERRTKRSSACVCGLIDDDTRPAVQCDRCLVWYHLDCVGIEDEDELGAEADPWYCPRCTRESTPDSGPGQSSPDGRPRQPTFVPTDEQPPRTFARRDVPLYSSSSPYPSSVQSPSRNRGYPQDLDTFRRSLWDEPSSSAQLTAGPSTPRLLRNVKAFTPGGHIDWANDPISTPSRGGTGGFSKPGIQFTTPKNNVTSGSSGMGSANLSLDLPWASRVGGVLATPTPGPRMRPPHPIFGSGGGGSAGFGYYGFGTGGPSLYAVDDTPIRRAPVRETRMTEQLSLKFSSPTLRPVGTGDEERPLVSPFADNSARPSGPSPFALVESPVSRSLGTNNDHEKARGER